ncbi:MAG: hypothetical protein LBH74_02150 [Nitrososphaerota archaeon]|nr:hypothetical protein [Nitrososphaerota archaeon]
MLQSTKKYLLLLSIFVFAFVYRMLLMLWSGFPPGADIGLHNSVIYSITGAGPTDFLYNAYHIGGGISLTFPGYHIFTTSVMMLTGLPEYIAHVAIVGLFSALMVVCAFLITQKAWSVPAAFIVAVLMVISRFDIEMLLWSGYPNVITLMLIPLTFYLYLQKDRFSKAPFLISTSILAAALFLTHSLSAAMFGGITVAVALFVLLFPDKFGVSRKIVLYWGMSIALGAVLVLPFLVKAIPTYLKEYGSSEITGATLSARVLPLELVLPLFGIFVAFFVFSKKFYNKPLTLPAFFLSMWVGLPLILTQGYLVGLPVDYNRFMYFLLLPMFVFMAVLIDYGSDFFAKKINAYLSAAGQPIQRYAAALTSKRLYSMFIVFFLLFSFTMLPIFMTPALNVGHSTQDFYQAMTEPGWDAIQWIKANTSPQAVFVADAWYGWWLGGFAQRPTLSAVDPQYLTVNREVDNATFARTLLDTDYVLDNGYIQVRDDGGYIARHNPEILVAQNWTYYPYSFFNFDSKNTKIEYQINGRSQPVVSLAELVVKDMQIESNYDQAKITVVRGNDDFNYTVSTILYRNVRFVNLTSTLTSLHSGVVFNRVHIDVEATGFQVHYNNKVTIALVETGTKSFGQLIFTTPPETVDLSEKGDPKVVEGIGLTYFLDDQPQGEIQMLAGAYSASNNPGLYTNPTTINNAFIQIVSDNLVAALNPMEKDRNWTNFDYRAELQARSITYVVCRLSDAAEAEIIPKFRLDPMFSLVFINKEVAIFRVNGDLG